jgi:hypothetical protein
MNLLGFWRNATAPPNRLCGSGASNDRSHTAHRLQTTLTPAQEAVAVALRKTLLVSLDDLLAVVRELLNPSVSRSGLDRCLRRHGVGDLRDLTVKTVRPKPSSFKVYEPGYIHIELKYLPQMVDQTSRRYLFVAIDPLPDNTCKACVRGGLPGVCSFGSTTARHPRTRVAFCGI